ncbi:HNH endonuclease [Agromyces marinus]|uniref:HNH endonuclease n=1 Tax=Agromyces marinus TaxID=1389020 RepID=A0ABN6YCF5_9MICO|nr:HNH endonuclease signature motif containing protein [Agromyces marinus]BDZ55039.1 HNH endonuclease [Agromyces marinus]
MDEPLTPLERELDALRDAWSAAMPAFGPLPGGAQVEPEQMSDAGLVRVTDALAELRRGVDALLARTAAEVARRSGPEFGDVGLAKAQGFHNATRLVAASTGASRSDAARLISVGSATAARASISGERMPPRRAHVAQALDRAAISLEAASAISTMLDRVALRADPALVEVAEAALTELAERAPLEIVIRGVREAEARLDADGVEPREEQLREQRSLTMREDRHGVVHLNARLDPETAAPIRAAVEAFVTDALRRRDALGQREAHPSASSVPGVRPVLDDRRSIPQLQADGLAAIARHALGCEQTLTPLAKTTVVVRVDLDALVSGLGDARIDGYDQPISAGTARRLAADAELIPAVLGTPSLPLDLGRAARLFTRAQRIALGERDGGCASCGQNIGYVEAHHIRWWERDAGPTDLANGVLLCSFCHHQVHRDGWEIRAQSDAIWFIPPRTSIPTACLGGRARFDLQVTDAAA